MADTGRLEPRKAFIAFSAVGALAFSLLAALQVVLEGLTWSVIVIAVLPFFALLLLLAMTLFAVRPRLLRFGSSRGLLRVGQAPDRDVNPKPSLLALVVIIPAPATVVAIAAMALGHWSEGVTSILLAASAGATAIGIWFVSRKERVS